MINRLRERRIGQQEQTIKRLQAQLREQEESAAARGGEAAAAALRSAEEGWERERAALLAAAEEAEAEGAARIGRAQEEAQVFMPGGLGGFLEMQRASDHRWSRVRSGVASWL